MHVRRRRDRPNGMNTKKRILILMIDSGGGHRSPALAIRESIEALHPGVYGIEVLDFARHVGALRSDARLKGAWNYALAHPRITRMTYSLFADLLGGVPFYDAGLDLGDFSRKAAAFLEAFRPDLILNVHHATALVTGRLRARGRISCPVLVFNTEIFMSNFFWSDAGVLCDLSLAATEEARRDLVGLGVPQERTAVCGFPLRRRFLEPAKPREEVLAGLGLDPSLPTVLASDGGQGIGKVGRYVKEIVAARMPFNVIAVCGRNARLRDRLVALKDAFRGSGTVLAPLGFVENMPDLLAASDFTIAKAGASSTFEAMYSGTPIVFAEWAAQNERPNVEYCVRHGLGWYAPTVPKLIDVLGGIRDGRALERCRENLRGLRLASGSDRIARIAVEWVESSRTGRRPDAG